MKTKAWTFDAGSVVYSMDLKNELYYNDKIINYLQIGDHDHQFFLIGPKGLGKTLFINMKSYLYRQQLEKTGFVVYPKVALCENLIVPSESLSKDDLLKFSTYDMWNRVWLFTLSVMVCITANIELTEEINVKINKSNTCSSILTLILSERSRLNSYFECIPRLIQLIDTVKNGVAIFIDNVDQAFRNFLTEYHYTDHYDGISPSVKVWTNAQNGLMSSIYDLSRHNSHIKIFATIRSEAFNAFEGEMKLNFKNYSTDLKYTKDEIKSIYELNIDLMDEKKLTSKNSGEYSERFVGFSKMPHSFAKSKNNKKKIESTFDFLYRHTLGRPREIVYMGHQIQNNLLGTDAYKTSKIQDKVEKLRWEVNEISNYLLKRYLEEIIPEFNNEDLLNFLNIVQCNVIPSLFLNKELEKRLYYYYSLGIIGYIKRKNHHSPDDQYVQEFLPPAQYGYNSHGGIPKSKYYLTHPTIDGILKELFDLSFYNKFNIIGNGYDFKDEKYITRKYDVALSYAGENRDYVEQVAIYLKGKNISVFYDNHHKTSLWGKDLYQHLNVIYKELAKCCVIFISEHYPIKSWTRHELKSAQARAFEEEEEYILPVRFDDTKISGLNETVGYIEASSVLPSELADAIIDKIKKLPNMK